MPVEHSADADEGVLRISVRRIAGSSVAPAFPAANEIQSSDYALTVQVFALIRSQLHLSAILQAAAINLHAFIRRRFVRDIIVSAVNLRHNAKHMRGHMVNSIAKLHQRPADYLRSIVIAVLVHPRLDISIFFYCVGRYVIERNRLEMAVDVTGFGFHHGSYSRVLTPARSKNDAWHKVYRWEYFVEYLQTFYAAIAHAYAANHQHLP